HCDFEQLLITEIYPLSLHVALPILWLAQCAQRVAPLPVDREAGIGTIADAQVAAIQLDAEDTRALQQQCHAAYRTQINELLLARSEEHTSELQSRENLVCRLLLEKK